MSTFQNIIRYLLFSVDLELDILGWWWWCGGGKGDISYFMNVLEFLCVAVWAMARKFKCNNNYKTKMGKETVLSLNGPGSQFNCYDHNEKGVAITQQTQAIKQTLLFIVGPFINFMLLI